MKKVAFFLVLLLFVSFILKSCKKEPPVANFNCDKTSGYVPLTVQFTSTSTGDITSYSWNFGDGSTSTDQNLSHIYHSAGIFTATLTVTGPGGSNSKNTLITVIEPEPVASFTCDKTSGYVPLTVQFTSTSSGAITTYSWNFGDGGTSTSQNPSHTYNNCGTGAYTVTLTVTGPGGSNSFNTTITVPCGTNIKFNNPVFTSISVTLNSVTKTIAPGSSVTFSSVPGSSVYYSANTKGVTSTGTQVGLQMTWNGTLTLTGGTTSYDLNVPSSYFFIYITNNGTHTLEKLYVNYNLTSQTYDAIVIANNKVKCALGYYKAWTNSNVRMYWQGSTTTYVYWNQGTHFTLPWTNNQYANLSSDSKSENISPIDKSNMFTTQFSDISVSNLLPAQSFVYKKDPNAIDLYCK
jgi:PKD repeat protein